MTAKVLHRSSIESDCIQQKAHTLALCQLQTPTSSYRAMSACLQSALGEQQRDINSDWLSGAFLVSPAFSSGAPRPPRVPGSQSPPRPLHRVRSWFPVLQLLRSPGKQKIVFFKKGGEKKKELEPMRIAWIARSQVYCPLVSFTQAGGTDQMEAVRGWPVWLN